MLATVNGAEIFFDIEGAGLVTDGEVMRQKETCFVLHGGPAMDHTYFKPHLSPLAEDMQLIYVDHRNTGRSGRMAVESCTIEQMADDIEALRQLLGLGKVHVLGNSFGGMWAMTYALRHPDSLARLLLVTTSPSYGFYEAAKAEAARKGTPEQIAAIPDLFEGAIDNDADLERWWKLITPLYYAKWDDKYWAGGGRGHHNAELMSHMWKNVMPHFDVRPGLPTVTAPTLVMGGRHDWVTPYGQSELIAASIPNSRLVIFEESGHFPFVEEQEKFTTVVRDFLGYSA